MKKEGRTNHTPAVAAPNSGIRDNYKRGTVGNFLKEKIQSGSSLSIVSAYFTIYAFTENDVREFGNKLGTVPYPALKEGIVVYEA